MKTKSLMAILLSGSLLLSGCGMSNTAKGGLIGAGGGAVLGGIIGKIAGNTAVGAAVGGAVGTGVGIIVGKKMDKAAQAAKQVQGAQVQNVTDINGLPAVKVTFDSGILFTTSSSTLSASAKSSLQKFAADVLNQNKDMDVAILGYTDNQAWRNSTAEQSVQKNLTLSEQRAQSVASYLKGQGVASSQIKTIKGMGEADPVADNTTASGREQNRRVEVYLYASKEMINDAQANN